MENGTFSSRIINSTSNAHDKRHNLLETKMKYKFLGNYHAINAFA